MSNMDQGEQVDAKPLKAREWLLAKHKAGAQMASLSGIL